jgi:hypothetical protein
MKLLRLALVLLLGVVGLTPGRADEQPARPPSEVVLDIDHDGKLDRAVLVEDAASGAADLYIYLATGRGKRDLSRKPAILKKKLTTARILRFEKGDDGSLIVMSGCGGCSNDYATTLTIVYRGGAFRVGRATYDWDTRAGIGSCDVNFLAGKASVSHGLAKGRSIRGKFAPVKLTDWSNEKMPTGCN